MKHSLPYLATLLCATLALGLRAQQCPTPVWSDEFDGATLDLTKWSHDVNTNCDTPPCSWYNKELQQYYPENTKLVDGELVITATKAPAGAKWAYNSSRILTQGKYEFTYGHVEARVKVPSGGGTWPAFWLLSDQQKFGPWPLSGEIDILEWVGNKPDEVLGTIHYGNTPGSSIFSSEVYKPGGAPVADEWHTYAVEWSANEISWFYDGYKFFTRTRADIAPQAWPFMHDFFIILNLAVGGTLGGAVDPSAFPAEMRVDYVRVYKEGKPFLTGPREVAAPGAEATYRIGNVAAGTSVTWAVPEGTEILSGQGTPVVRVRFGDKGGRLSAKPTNSCITDEEWQVFVKVPAAKQRLSSLLNFDDGSPLKFESASGTFAEVDNPAPAAPNTSQRVGRYVRAAGSQYDVLTYRTGAALPTMAPFVAEERAFYMDLYTDAPVGTEVLLQFETAAAAGAGYPTGRQSRYIAKVLQQNAWQRLPFKFVDRPDANASNTAITQMVILFAPDTYTANTYTFDNLDIYGALPSGTREASPYVAEARLRGNPVGETLTVDFELLGRNYVGLSVVDALGRTVLRQGSTLREAGEQRMTVDVDALPSGMYRLVIWASGAQQALGFVKD